MSILSSVEVVSSELSLSNKKLIELPYRISFSPSLFLHDDNLLLCGGQRNLNQCFVYTNNSWKEYISLSERRRWASAVTTANGTFIFGGDERPLTFEFLPKNSKVWKDGRTKIPDGFYKGCAIEVPNKLEILLIGGYETEKRILKFDMTNQTFEEMNVSLIKERLGHTCARLPDTNLIVIAGGRDSDYNDNDPIEILNLDDNTITLGNSMNTKRRFHGMAVITIEDENRLAVFGGAQTGHDGIDILDSVETLNPRTRNWEVSELKLTEAKGMFGYTSVHNDFISKL